MVSVKEVYIHCSRALVRADLWNPAKFAAPGTVRDLGTMLAAHTKGFVDGPTVDEDNNPAYRRHCTNAPGDTKHKLNAE